MIPVFTTAIMGVLIGLAGRVIMPVKDSGGIMATAVLGICGANLTASIGWLSGLWEVGSLIGYGAGAAGAVAMLVVYRMFSVEEA